MLDEFELIFIIFCGNREIALEVLSREPVGAFMVRESTSKPGCYALSLRVPRDFTVSGIAHYLIVKTNKGYKIKVCFLHHFIYELIFLVFTS